MITLATICLNEEQFIEAWLGYHYASFDRIVICEGAARNYPQSFVSSNGLSLDKTASIIKSFPDPFNKISLIQYGWAGPQVSTDPNVPSKIELRNVYAEEIQNDGYVYTLDVDEFLHPDYISALVGKMETLQHVNACFIPQLHLWQDTRHFITGGYADIPHCRLYRWKRGTRYTINHNWPSGPDGVLLSNRRIQPTLAHSEGLLRAPAIVHYGFCEAKHSMEEKNAYYVSRGEQFTRPVTMEFRNAAFAGVVPSGCIIHEYCGFIPFHL